jgi:hypothetical protein
MNPPRLIVEISNASPSRLENLERRAGVTKMSAKDRAAVKRAIANRRAYFASPEFLAKLVRTL